MRVRRIAAPLAVLTGLAGVPIGAAAAAPAETTHTALWGPAAAPYGATVRLQGYLRDRTGATIPGRVVQIQRSARQAGAWSTFTTRRLTAGQITFAVDVTQGRPYDYRAHFLGGGRYAASTSRTVYPAVQWKVLFDGVRTTSQRTGGLRAVGRVYPAPPAGSTGYLQAYLSSARGWRTIGTGRTVGSALTVDTRVGGSNLRYRLYVPGSSSYAAGASTVRSHQHFVWRGVYKRPLLARGGTVRPEYKITPASEVPELSEAELLAGRGGSVWGDLNTRGCLTIRAWLANLTDGTVRVALRRGNTTLGAIDMRQDSEAVLIRSLAGSPRTRLSVTDRTSTGGPYVPTDTHILCNN